jgi:hypothetical protein
MYYTYTISDIPGDVLITYVRKMGIAVLLGGLPKLILIDDNILDGICIARIQALVRNS